MAPNSTFMFPVNLRESELPAGKYKYEIQIQQGKKTWQLATTFTITGKDKRAIGSQLPLENGSNWMLYIFGTIIIVLLAVSFFIGWLY